MKISVIYILALAVLVKMAFCSTEPPADYEALYSQERTTTDSLKYTVDTIRDNRDLQIGMASNRLLMVLKMNDMPDSIKEAVMFNEKLKM